MQNRSNKNELLETFRSSHDISPYRRITKPHIPIDKLTMAAIHSEVINSVKLPATIYAICLALVQSECLASFHSSPINNGYMIFRGNGAADHSKSQECSTFVEEKSIPWTMACSVIKREGATPGKVPNDMSMLLKSFGSLTVASKKQNNRHTISLPHSKMRAASGDAERGKKGSNVGSSNLDPRTKALRKALLDLSKRIGSTSTKCYSWGEVVHVLSEIIKFPVAVEEDVAQDKALDDKDGCHNSKPLPPVSVITGQISNRGSLKAASKRSHPPFLSSSFETTPTVPLRPLVKKYKVFRNVMPRQQKIERTTIASKRTSSADKFPPYQSFQIYLDSITRAAQLAGQLSKSASSWRQVISFGEKIQGEILSNKEVDAQQQQVKDEEDTINSLAVQLRITEDEKLLRDKTLDERVEKLRKDKEELQKAIAPLSDADMELINQALYGPGRSDEIVANAETDSVQRESLRKLRPGVWLNDEIIHYFLTLLAQRDAKLCSQQQGRRRCHFFKSFFLTKLLDDDKRYNYANVKRWSKKVPGKDIFALDKIIFPVNVSGMHWCCAVARMQSRTIQFYDSLGGDGMIWLKGIFQYIQDEHMDKKKIPLPDKEAWRLIPCQPNCPQQNNGYDCGVFTCAFADYLSVDKELNFGQSHVTELRQRIALSIIKGNAAF